MALCASCLAAPTWSSAACLTCTAITCSMKTTVFLLTSRSPLSLMPLPALTRQESGKLHASALQRCMRS